MSSSNKNRNTRSERMRRRRRKKRIIRGGLILALILAAAIVLVIALGGKQEEGTDSPSDENITISQSVPEEKEEDPVPTDTPAPTPEPLEISTEGLHSDYALLLRLRDDAVLMDKAGTEQMYPASMTKIMTALLAIENLPNLDEQITVTAEEINPAYELGASMAGFNAGETVTVRDLLYGVLLPSGAEACAALADRVAGSETAFVDLMNQKAQELGMENTHFVTVSGLHDPNHYTTCYDIAILLKYAIQNETFRTIFTTPSYTTSATEDHPQWIALGSTMFAQLGGDPKLDNGGVIEGGKTGTEDAAGHCLASLALIDGEEYILVTGHAPDSPDGTPYIIADARYVYNQL